MAYREQLENAANWLLTIKNADGGWGLTEGQSTSFTNTAEAIYVLFLHDPIKHRSTIDTATDFIKEHIFKAIDKQPRVRYAVFALYAALISSNQTNSEWKERLIQWLIKNRNSDGGWGHQIGTGSSCFSATALTLWVLNKYSVDDGLSPTVNWLLAQFSQDKEGWSFSPQPSASPTASALAISALYDHIPLTHKCFETTKKLLLSNSQWNLESEDLPGTNWYHCSYQWIFPAMQYLNMNPYEHNIAEGVVSINMLNCKEGWREPYTNHLTIRGQYWAAIGLNGVQKAFDPSIHTYRMDSAIHAAQIQEPEYVVINVGKKIFALHSQYYKAIAYLLLFISALVFFGRHRAIFNIIPRSMDALIASLFGACGYWLIHKRHLYFHKWIILSILSITFIFGLLHSTFGISIKDMMDYCSRFYVGYQANKP